jgi:molecular chaperone DnaJ
MTTHYETLGISKEASAERIKRSYRTLVKIYHPDKFPSGSEAQAEAEKQMRDINVALYGALQAAQSGELRRKNQ